MSESGPLPRRRVEIPRDDPAPARRLWEVPGIPSSEAARVRGLVRAQLRLALVLLAGFAVTMALAATAIAVIPWLHEATVLGVPWSWMLQAYGLYPLVVGFAVAFVAAAGRLERRFRSTASGR